MCLFVAHARMAEVEDSVASTTPIMQTAMHRHQLAELPCHSLAMTQQILDFHQVITLMDLSIILEAVKWLSAGKNLSSN